MKLIKGLLDYSAAWALPNIYLFTGNPIIKNNGALVMGRGAAKQIRDSYPGIDWDLGQAVKRTPTRHIVWHRMNPAQFLGWFKVKDHWKDAAIPDVIETSVKQLGMIIEDFPQFTFHMNYPGIGNGHLAIEDVHPLLESLPDNVWIYK